MTPQEIETLVKRAGVIINGQVLRVTHARCGRDVNGKAFMVYTTVDEQGNEKHRTVKEEM